MFVLPDVAEPKATPYKGVIAEVGEWVRMRWTRPPTADAREISVLNEGNAIAVATSHFYDNLYGKSAGTFFRARMHAEGMEAERCMKALARDLAIEETICAAAPPSLDDVASRLSSHPVKTNEQRLLEAMLGSELAIESTGFIRRDGMLVSEPHLRRR